MNPKNIIEDLLRPAISEETPIEITVPERAEFGHYSTNIAMRLASMRKKAPLEIARELALAVQKNAPSDLFEKIEAVAPGFINFWVSKDALRGEINSISKNIKKYGVSQIGKNKTVIVEYSQPNIAKKMHVGHLRTTLLGDSFAKVFDMLGYKVIRWNYIGDWGTQFGKLIAAYKLWGSKEAIKKDPIAELQKLYVRFHDEMKRDASLEDRGREEFKKLEEGDKENRKLWEWFKKESLKEFDRAYKVLGVKFDTFIGESDFQKEMKPLVAELLKSGIAEKSEGAVIISLGKYGFNLPPALIQKADGASLYLARDIAGFKYRIKKFKPEKILYVVGNEQTLHFEQLFAIAKILKVTDTELAHIKYGLVLGESGKKLATREGRTVSADEVIGKAVNLAREVVSKKNSELSAKEKNEVARVVGIGAVKYANLKENRHSDIIFDWDRMLDFTGDSAPYIQYTYARFRNILAKAPILRQSFGGQGKNNFKNLSGDTEFEIIRKILDFPSEIERSGEQYAINNLANYVYQLSNLLNKLYETTPILKEADPARRSALLSLIDVSTIVLQKSLALLGIEALERI